MRVATNAVSGYSISYSGETLKHTNGSDTITAIGNPNYDTPSTSLEFFALCIDIDSTGSIGSKKLQEQCDYYQKLFQISTEDLVDVSYSDIISQT